MSTAKSPVDEWNTLPWRQYQRTVFKLQTRIDRAKRRGDEKAVRRLQRLLVRSRSAKLLAVRRVSQDNRGKRTAGVDGVKLLTPAQRLALAARLTLPTKARPTRRVWIPKPGTTEQRPLGIPTMGDRAAQALLKLALEPEWEAVFEPNSYGFRPGRSVHDAIGALFTGIKAKPKYVLDADIARCFDRIDQQALVHKLHTTPTFRRAIRAWLKAGVLEGPTLFPTEAGTPQGGVRSPLLANVALHGLETAIVSAFPATGTKKGVVAPIVVRYADDFVVLHPDLPCVERAQAVATSWLADMGLELKPSKTHVGHTLHAYGGQAAGFDFLGFTVRQFRVGKTHSGKTRAGARLGFKTIIRPSKAALGRHARALGQKVRYHKAATQAALIGQLNPIIAGWSRYYSAVVAKAAFSDMDHVLFAQLRRWGRRRHPGKSAHWVARQYWHPEQGRWRFATRDGMSLRKHATTAIRRHVKVRSAKSPFDGDWSYWAARTGRHPSLPGYVAAVLRRQGGRCVWCGLHFGPEEPWEIDHRIPLVLGGQRCMSNLQLLHRHCHDQKTAEDGSSARGTRDKDRTSEEPDEGKAFMSGFADESVGRPVGLV